jgi:gamma-glutamylcyclotransferase (GGCT)/AIG2-like uncharacterized protein YtfP
MDWAMTEKLNEQAVASARACSGIEQIRSAPATHRMFVYGTLMASAVSDYGLAARTRLIREASSKRWAATTQGHLYELGRYPGLVTGTGAGLVHGELFLLSNPTATLPWLDEYEAISLAPRADDEYVRELIDVIVLGGPTLSAWTYRYVRSTTGLKRIASGRWVT